MTSVVPIGDKQRSPRVAFELRVADFPEYLQPTLASIDREGNGVLDQEELLDIFTMYRDIKAAQDAGQGAIPISSLPKELAPTLKVFDQDGDGTVAPQELARAAELYRASKQTTKYLTRAVGALSLFMLLMLACITGLTFAVVELSKETKVSPDGRVTVAGTDQTAKMENPYFGVGGREPVMTEGGRRRRLLTDSNGTATTVPSFMDANGVAIASASLTNDEGQIVGSDGSSLAVDQATHQYDFSEGLSELLDLSAEVRDALDSLQVTTTDGASIKVDLTGWDFRERFGVAATDSDGTPTFIPTDDVAAYDVAHYLLVFRTTHSRYPMVVIQRVMPLSDAGRAMFGAQPEDFSTLVKTDEVDTYEDLLAASSADLASGSANGRRLLWGCNWVCQLQKAHNNMKNTLSNARRNVNQLNRKVQNLKNSASQIMGSVNDAISQVTDLPTQIADGLEEKLSPLQSMSGCDIVNQLENFVNGKLGGNDLCFSPACGGSHINSGESESIFDDDVVSVSAMTDVSVCLKLYGLSLNCEGIEATINEFWAENPLRASIEDIVSNLPGIEELQKKMQQIKQKTQSISGRRLLEEEQVFAKVDAMHAHAHERTVAHISERLREFATRRGLAESNSLMPEALRAKATLGLSSLWTVVSEAEYVWTDDIADIFDAGELAYTQTYAVPATFGLVTVGVEAEMQISLPVDLSMSGKVQADIKFALSNMELDMNLYQPDDLAVSTGDWDGSNVKLVGTASVSTLAGVKVHMTVKVSLCLSSVCTGLVGEAKWEAMAGSDVALSFVTGGQNGWNMNSKWTRYAEYSDADLAVYSNALASANTGFVLGGGAWTYVTFPHVKLYPMIAAGACEATGNDLFKFSSTNSLHDTLEREGEQAHPLGKYMLRTSIAFGESLQVSDTDTNADGSFPLAFPKYTSSSGRRHLLAGFETQTDEVSEVACHTSTGADAEGEWEKMSAVPATSVTCAAEEGVRTWISPNTGVVHELCHSRACCHSHAIRINWSRFACLPEVYASAL
mmetsp:Transcript_1587/g.5458  ORF Transcript_1587/g.5458 Transcript_1587/m.5458 type:complete len:1019 (-) Transcript_1587:29-3085(-)|eukprot:CAMPEP_0183796144 /NCGR_PEP_ID=MMETSP0803_2-20130417/8755_1 /TAXON_ID=195967 /ORGANISM="Crustomastix stigmata, Strain CCMP3273" /LENGTH=1018 /DNA_ID=CAMNT_0026040759 /DNA_START=133 /DNA_END=3185 /DNA_ORIENTATION=-